MEKPNCFKCRHFQITWDPKTPNGCKLFGIKAKEMPSRIVEMSGMGKCQEYEAKPPRSEVRK